jgi:hypothetical protein
MTQLAQATSISFTVLNPDANVVTVGTSVVTPENAGLILDSKG